jgi:hypothetical protein
MRWLCLCSCLALGLLAVGCKSTPIVVSSGKSVYSLQRSYDSYRVIVKEEITECHGAVLSGLRELGLKPTEDRIDKLSGQVSGNLATGEPFVIKLRPQGAELTELSLRVGALADRDLTQRLFEAIAKHL